MASRRAFRKPITTRVSEILTTRTAIWVVGFAVGLASLVVVTVLGLIVAGLLVVPFVVAGTAGVIAKDRVLILRRRILVKRDPQMSRRQLLAMMLAVSVAAGLTAALGWLLGTSMLTGYNDKVQRYMTRKPKKKAS